MTFKLTRKPPTANQQYNVWRKALINGLQPVADVRAKRYARAVSSWDSSHKPDFKGEVGAGRVTVRIRVLIKNGSQSLGKYGGTIRDLWHWWNRGTGLHGPKKQAYPIYPRFKSVLRFFVGSVEVFTQRVDKPGKTHPGMRGSGEKNRIDKDLRPIERKEINKAIKASFGFLERSNRRGR